VTDVEVSPGMASGTIDAPPSKSYTHRALLAGHLTRRTYQVVRPLDAEDTRATAQGLEAFGTHVERDPMRWTLRPARSVRRPLVRCGASGTTLRLLAGLSALSRSPTKFSGTRRLGQRPMDALLSSLAERGVTVRHPERSSLPLTLTGPATAGGFRVGGGESSQFISSLLFVLPRLAGNSTLQVTGVMVSAPYVAATLAVMRAHGVQVSGRSGRWRIAGGQEYRLDGFEVPGDASSAAYLWAAAAVSGGSVSVRGIPAQWPQADSTILRILQNAGARVRVAPNVVTVSGHLTTPIDVDLTPCPDLYPLVGALGALIPGVSLLRGAPQIVGKESDRRAATIDLVRRLNGRARLRPAGLEITGTRRPTPVRGARWDDHRLVMSAAVASLGAARPARLGHRAAVRKSYPGFWRDLKRLGISMRNLA
jgi:3-phosphoshikimate 1-carboxyvinyltransferase